MFLSFLNILLDLAILFIVILILIIITSIIIIRNMKIEYKKVFRANSKFEIELRKLVNLMYKFLNNDKLQPYNNVVIKSITHEEKRQLLKLIEEVFKSIDKEKKDNQYICETFNNLEEIRRLRDSKVLLFNQKMALFPFNIYFKILKFEKYYTYTD